MASKQTVVVVGCCKRSDYVTFFHEIFFGDLTMLKVTPLLAPRGSLLYSILFDNSK